MSWTNGDDKIYYTLQTMTDEIEELNKKLQITNEELIKQNKLLIELINKK